MADYQNKSKYTRNEIDARLERAGNVSNPNLLDNWYFGNPVDQRDGYVYPPDIPYSDKDGNQIGTTSQYLTIDVNKKNPSFTDWAEISIGGTVYYGYIPYAVRGYTGYGYGIDRWSGYAGTTFLVDTHTLITNTAYGRMVQLLEERRLKKGTVVTFSALIEDLTGGHFALLTTNDKILASVPAGTNGIVSATFEVGDSKNGNHVFFPCLVSANSSVKLHALKLELGTQQTLAHQDADGNWVLNEMPNYADTLARCQRYFQTFATESLRPTDALDFRPVMRANPALSTITVDGKTLYTASADL